MNGTQFLWLSWFPEKTRGIELWTTLYNNDFSFSSFPGFRYVPPGENPEMVVIYDVNGFIAGMQSIVAKKFIQGPYDFAGSNWYRSDNVLGKVIVKNHYPAISYLV